MVRVEDVVFWVFIIIIVGTALWLLSGSPPEISAIITIGLAVAGSELMLWKKIFAIDRDVKIGFVKVKHDTDKFKLNINNRFDNMDNKLNKLLES